MASNEEGSTHTRTIQKRAKKTQDQACQFDAALLEGERERNLFAGFTQCLLRPVNTMLLSCYAYERRNTNQTRLSFVIFFQKKEALVKLAIKFRGKENFN